jgi:bacteriocin biosynthesis cyclodehydratase domain-containing protein
VRPVVRPGLRILRRDLRTLQLGLDWPGLCTLPDSPAIRAVLAAVDGFRDLPGVLLAAVHAGVNKDDASAALDVLMDCGAVVDQAPCGRRDQVDEANWAAWWLLAGPGRVAGDIAAERAQHHVRVSGSGRIAARVCALLGTAHICWSSDDGVPRSSSRRSAPPVDAVVIAVDQEPPRTLGDQYMREGVPHLWASLRDVVGIVGPFVLPGVTGCLRCSDTIRAERDPAWPTLLESVAARRPAEPPVDPLTAELVAALAASEVAVWASGLPPQTFNAVIEMPQGIGPVERYPATLHPQCGCGWPVWRDTMGA